MKNLLLLIALLPSTLLMSSIEVKGTVVFENDSIVTTLYLPKKLTSKDVDFPTLQYGFSYKSKEGKKVGVGAGEVKEIHFKYNGEYYRMISMEFVESKVMYSSTKYMFLRIHTDGEVKLFTYYYNKSFGHLNGAGGIPIPADRLLVQKGNEKIQDTKDMSSKEILKYFSDCPVLAERIEKEKNRKDEIETYVKFYNKECVSKRDD